MSFAIGNNEYDKNLEQEWVKDEQRETLANINEVGKQANKFLRDIAKLRQYEAILGTPQDTQKIRSEAFQFASQLGNTLSSLKDKFEELNLSVEYKVDSHSPSPLKKVLDYVSSQMKKAEDEFYNSQEGYIEKSQHYTLINTSGQTNLRQGSGQSLQTRNPPDLEHQSLLAQKRVETLDQTYLPQLHADLVQQREAAISNISQGVQDINLIFRDLDHLVNQQGTQIDTIENNIHNYATNNQMANQELIRADNYQRQKGKWSCIILIILVIVILILLALLS